MQYREIQGWNNTNILRNVLHICSNSFPKLKHAVIESLYDFDIGMEIMTSYLGFLQRHSKTLQKFSLQFSLIVNDQFVRVHEPINVGENDLLSLTAEMLETLQLKRINFVSLCLSILPYASVWSSIIEAQRDLHDIIVVGVLHHSEFLQKIIHFNHTTLTNISISRIILFENQTPTQLDCNIFSPCKNLRCLGLRGWTVSVHVNTLINTDRLPKTLKFIDLGDMAVATSDIRYMATEMPNLIDLELRYVGHKRGMGMDIDTLEDILSRKQIKECRLQRSICDHLDEKGVFNRDDKHPEYITESDNGFLGFKLHNDGYYTSMLPTDNFF
jgi:hypothetical protein